MNSEPYALRTTVGLEVTSNDRRLRYIVRRSTSYLGSIESDFYTAYCYVRDGSGWQPATHSETYLTEADFLKTIERSDEFTRALAELNA